MRTLAKILTREGPSPILSLRPGRHRLRPIRFFPQSPDSGSCRTPAAPERLAPLER